MRHLHISLRGLSARGQVLVWLFVACVGLVCAMSVPSRAADAPAAPAPAGNGVKPGGAEYRLYEWKRGAPPVRMIAKDEGFCFLSEFGGHFAGGGEAVRVYIGDDGFWYLGGKADQDIWAKAISVKFAQKLASAVVAPPISPEQQAWAGELKKLAGGKNAAIAALAARETPALPSDPAALMDLADQWEKATRNQSILDRRLIEAHVNDLYETATGKLTGSALAAARKRFDVMRLAMATRELNDLGEWSIGKGEWSATPDGKIMGKGDSELTLKHDLPADCFIEFHMNVMDGMRPRVLFPGTDLYIGNEGFFHQIEMYGAETQRGVSFPYSNGQEMKLGINFSGKNVDLYINGELMARGMRRNVPTTLAMVLRGGDDWSTGTTLFWDFKASPPKSAAPGQHDAAK